LGVKVKRVRRNLFVARPSGVPADLVMYRLKPEKPGKASKENDAATSEATKDIAVEGDSPQRSTPEGLHRDDTSPDAPPDGVPAEDTED
jgi:hypothetical protein